MSQATQERPGLLRAIGRWDLTAAVINAVIGSSIFGMPARQAELLGALSPLAYVAAGLGILAIVLCFAEVASRFQDAGGPYLYARESFGPFVGFDYVIIMYSGVVLGGMGSIFGAFWGGVTVGFVQQFSALILPPQLQNAAIFVVFLLIVLLRPQGLFGRSAERA